MAAKTQILQYSFLVYIVLLGISCTIKKNKYTDTEMINLAETYINDFHEQGVSQIQLRSDYYICTFVDSSSYLITCDSKVIRNISNKNEIISTDASKDYALPDSLQHLLKLVENIHLHEIDFVDVDTDVIKMKKIDGYYLTNEALFNNNSNVRIIQGKWLVYPKDSI